MYDGPRKDMTLRCRKSITGRVIDKFGEQIEIKNVRQDTFDITVPVSNSAPFCAWVFKFVGK